jgi:hypothetical protein
MQNNTLTVIRSLFLKPRGGIGVTRSEWTISITPTIVFLVSYLVTTVLAATIYMAPGGDEYISSRSGELVKNVVSGIGSPIYLALLYLPLIVTSISSLITIKLIKTIKKDIIITDRIRDLKINTPALAIISAIGTSFCMWKLQQAGALDLGALSSGDYIQKTIRRLNLLDNLGFAFFAFAYGINLIIPILAFIAFITQGEKLKDLLLFAITFCIFIFTITATYSKAQILIYLILAMVAFFLTKSKLKYIIIVCLVSVGAFILTGYAMQAKTGLIATPPEAKVQQKLPETAVQHNIVHDQTKLIEKPIQRESESRPLASYISKMTGDSLHRMAAATPYYVALFKNPEERCGIQGNLLRSILRAPQPACVLPQKVFNAMYPEIDWAQGMQPAPASLSAYGEIGLGWSVMVMILAGISLGVLGTIGSIGKGPLYTGFTVASSAFAYYLTQVPLIASFTYPHGLFAFMIPIAILAAVALMKNRRTS